MRLEWCFVLGLERVERERAEVEVEVWVEGGSLSGTLPLSKDAAPLSPPADPDSA